MPDARQQYCVRAAREVRGDGLFLALEIETGLAEHDLIAMPPHDVGEGMKHARIDDIGDRGYQCRNQVGLV